MLIRKSSLTYIGLYNTEFAMMDWEYSLRISHLKANIAYYTGYNALSVSHLQTVTFLKNNKLVNEQGKRACAFYKYPGDRDEISLWSEIKIYLGRLFYSTKAVDKVKEETVHNIDSIYNYYYEYLFNLNSAQNFDILKR